MSGQSAITDRNNDYAEAVRRISFPLGRTLLSHDYVFWCGDFNYRINMSRNDVKALVEEGAWDTLKSADQVVLNTFLYNFFIDNNDTAPGVRDMNHI